MGDGDTASGPEVITNDMTPERGSEPLNEAVTETTTTGTAGTAGTSESGDNSSTGGNTQDTGGDQSGAESVAQNTDSETSTGTRVSRGDAMELLSDEYSLHEPGEFSEVDPLDNTPTPHDFAEMYLPDGAKARHIAMGYDGRVATLDADNLTSDIQIGGWKTFDREAITERHDIDGGRTDSYMEIVSVESDEMNAEKAFVTHYDNDGAPHVRTPERQNARSRMGVHAALDAMGVRTPRHVFDNETKELFVEPIGGPDTDTVNLYNYHGTAEDDLRTVQDYIDKVDEDQFETMFAANMICGNLDLDPENMMVDENGNVVIFDYDFTESVGSLEELKSHAKRNIQGSINAVEHAKDGEFDVTVDSVVQRAGELAAQLKETGMDKRVKKASGEYDEFFNVQDPDEFTTRGTMDSTQKRLNRHIELWSEEVEL